MNNIEKFCKETGFVFQEKGEIGFGRECVGILDPVTDSYVAYEALYDDEGDSPSYCPIYSHSAEIADNAYHKGPYLAVLLRYIDKEAAIKELDEWVGRILAKGYKIQEYQNKGNDIAEFLTGKKQTYKVIVDLNQ